MGSGIDSLQPPPPPRATEVDNADNNGDYDYSNDDKDSNNDDNAGNGDEQNAEMQCNANAMKINCMKTFWSCCVWQNDVNVQVYLVWFVPGSDNLLFIANLLFLCLNQNFTASNISSSIYSIS